MVTDCYLLIEWPTTPKGCPEASGTVEWVRGEALMLASHPMATPAMLRRKDELIDLCISGANRHLDIIRPLMTLVKFEGDAVALQQAIHHQAQRWHFILSRQILMGLRGNAAIPWTWKEDAERNLDGL